MKILIIVESIKKAKTIQKIFDDEKDGHKYYILASMGHVVDLPVKEMGVDFENDFKETYVINPTKDKNRAKCIKNLIDTHNKCDKTILASDLDREGEAIAYWLQFILKEKKLDRIVFADTNKKTILNAVKNPLKINMDMVHAQQTRRLIDRIIGYTLSPLLQKSINHSAKSAGRVQSVAVRLIMDREIDIKHFFEGDVSSYFKTIAEFKFSDYLFKAQLYKSNKVHHLKNEDIILSFMEKCKKYIFEISDIEKKSSFKNPSEPFKTATLQQEASRKFGFTAKTTMSIAQHLYESGLITYMRTDSIILSPEILKDTKKYIFKKFGEEYYTSGTTSVKTKTKIKAQEAHECIRPTDIFTVNPSDISDEQHKLYQLIWKRTVASQMSSAEIGHTIVKIDIEDDLYFLSDIKKVIFDGFLKVYNIKTLECDEEEEDDGGIAHPKLKVGNILALKLLTVSEEYNKPPLRYNEATFTAKIDKIGIGRPATTAGILTKILEREYVVKKDVVGCEKKSMNYILKKKEIITEEKKILLGKEKNKYCATELGCIVTNFLIKHFSELMDYDYTAGIELELDKIAEGELEKLDVVRIFYDKFEPACKKARKIKKDIILGETSDGIEITVSVSKYGPIVTAGDKIVKIKEPLSIDTITYEDAVILLAQKFPIKIGEDIKIFSGKNGLYIRHKCHIISLNPITADMIDIFGIDDADYIIEEFLEERDKKIMIVDKKEYMVMEGKFGIYLQTFLKGKKKNYKIKSKDVTPDEVREIITRKKLKKNYNNHAKK